VVVGTSVVSDVLCDGLVLAFVLLVVVGEVGASVLVAALLATSLGVVVTELASSDAVDMSVATVVIVSAVDIESVVTDSVVKSLTSVVGLLV